MDPLDDNPVTPAQQSPDMQNGLRQRPDHDPRLQAYNFARTVGGDTSTTTPSSYNEIKKFAGFLGFVVDTVDRRPGQGCRQVKIFSPTNTLLTTQTTDEDGYYMFEYKHKAKSATYTVKLPAYNKSTAVTVKANGFAPVNFDVP